MSYIKLYCDSHEPLPVVMDDCFVNFDDQRTENAIRVIADWDPSIQTILLSCHRRVAEAVAKISPEAPVIDLGGESILPAAEFVSIQGAFRSL